MGAQLRIHNSQQRSWALLFESTIYTPSPFQLRLALAWWTWSEFIKSTINLASTRGDLPLIYDLRVLPSHTFVCKIHFHCLLLNHWNWAFETLCLRPLHVSSRKEALKKGFEGSIKNERTVQYLPQHNHWKNYFFLSLHYSILHKDAFVESW